MNKRIYLITLLLTCRICIAQNLVPNADFETFSGCPSGYSQLNLATPWINTSTGIGRCEYFNPCATSSNVSAPTNWFGFQIAHSGVGYCGLYLFNYNTGAPNFREYIEAPLSQTLITGVSYHFQMFIALANGSKFTTDDFGIYFSDTLVSGINNYYPLNISPQIFNPIGVITDTVNWTVVSGNYIASGSENYLIIGNFKDDANTNMDSANASGNIDGGYFYIDDVCLSSDSLDCISTVGINEVKRNREVILFPNPFSDKVNITVKRNELVEVTLFDVTSRKIFNQTFINSTSINTEQLAKGIYLYEVRNKNGVIMKGRVVKD